MKEERIMILNMVNDGKIKAEEAAILLEAIGKSHDERKKNSCYEDCAFDSSDMEDRLNKFSRAIDGFAKDFGDRMGATFKDIEPKFKKTSKTILEKTAKIIDDISQSLNESIKNMEEKDCQCDSDENCECDADEDCGYAENSKDDPREN